MKARMEMLKDLVDVFPGAKLAEAAAFLRALAGTLPKWKEEARAPFRKMFAELGMHRDLMLRRASRRKGFRLCEDPWARARGALKFMLDELEDDERKLKAVEKYLRGGGDRG